MLLAAGWSALGLVTLIAGADLLVRGGSRLATRLGISPLVVGLTVVALGTSAPELAIGIDAALAGNGALTVGNIAGTNIVNILLVLGLSAAIAPLALEMATLRFDLPVMVAAALVLWWMASDGLLSRLEGGVLVALAVAYTGFVVRSARKESAAVAAEFDAEFAAADPGARGATFRDATMLGIGLAIIVLGADWLVDGATGLARALGVSDALVGLTVVAIGTSAPELVTTVVSTLSGERDIAIGNLLGSSVYNILAILGVTCLVPPAGVPVAPELIAFDLPVMVGVALVCVPVFWSDRRITRLEGAGFVGAYVLYLGYLIATRT